MSKKKDIQEACLWRFKRLYAPFIHFGDLAGFAESCYQDYMVYTGVESMSWYDYELIGPVIEAAYNSMTNFHKSYRKNVKRGCATNGYRK